MKKLLAISLLFVGLNSSLNGATLTLKEATTIFALNSVILVEKFNNLQKDQATDNQAKNEIIEKVGVLTKIQDLSKGAQKLLEAKKPFGLLNIRDGVINYYINKITIGIIQKYFPKDEKAVQYFVLEEINKRLVKKFSPFKKDDCVSDALDLTVSGYDLYNVYKKLNAQQAPTTSH